MHTSEGKNVFRLSIAVDKSTVIEQFITLDPGSHPYEIPFGTTSMCRITDDTTELVAHILSEKLEHDDEQKQRLVQVLTTYFGKTGIDKRKPSPI